MRTKSSKKSGISLIVLVITIIVIIILAVAVILSIANNNPIENANKAKFQNDLKSIQEELELVKSSNYAENKGASYNNKDGSEITITNLSSAQKYNTKLRVDNGVLYYNDGLSAKEKEWAEEVGITDGAYVIGKAEDKGKTIDGVTISADGKTLSGQYTGTSQSIKVAEGVEVIEGIGDSIGPDMKGLFSNASAVTLPNSLKKIGNMAFCRNTSISNISIPGSVTHILVGAFYGCTNLKMIEIPESVTSIQSRAFENSQLETMIFINSKFSKSITDFYGLYTNCLQNNVSKIVLKGTTLTKEDIETVANGEAGPSRVPAQELLSLIENEKLVLEP